MAEQLLLRIRALFFYTGYVASLVPYASVCLIVGPFLPLFKRYNFFLHWSVFVLWWLKVTCGVTYRINGKNNVPPGPFIVLSNHQSPWETFYFLLLFNPICPILKKELLNIPFFGWGMRMLYPIAIDRSRRRQALASLLAQGKDRLGKGISVLVFPEGTRVDPGKRKPFSKGGAELAIQAGAKVLPMAHNAGRHWPSHKLIKYPGTIQVEIGAPIDPNGKTAKELTREAEDWVRENMPR